jgi:hypothetical protein
MVPVKVSWWAFRLSAYEASRKPNAEGIALMA